jgi:hypothetical protein
MATDLGKQAKEAVLRQLAFAHDHWSEEEQLLVAQGHPIEAQGAHEYAVAALKAYRAELDDPEPKEPA